MDKDIVMFLAIFTIGAVLLIGILSWTRAKRAKDHHHDAAVAERERDQLAAGKRDVRATTPHEEVEDASGRSWSEERGANPPRPMPPPD